MKKLMLLLVMGLFLVIITTSITEKVDVKQTTETVLEMEEESYVDDIPFNTEEIVKNLKDEEEN